MTINPDGTFNIEKGEMMPFICPKDGWPIPYDKDVVMINCIHCDYIGTPEDFYQEFALKEN